MRIHTLLVVYKYSVEEYEDIERVIIMLRCIVLAALAIISVSGGLPQKIMGGEVARPSQFPFIASVRVNGLHICGGSIISSRHILTAAHCVANLSWLVNASLSIVTGTNSPFSGGEVHAVETAHFHSEYNATDPSSPNDIAIIELKKPMRFNGAQKRIRIASSLVKDALAGIVIGWGYYDPNRLVVSHELRQATMETLGPGPCQIFLGTQLWTHQICGMSYPGSGTCLGDSGGPFIFGDELIGVTSYGTPCATGAPDVFTSVYHYRNWIKKNVGAGSPVR